MDTKIKKIRTAIFTRNFHVTDDAGRAQLLLDLNGHSGGIFNAPPMQVPIPNDAPPEFPRIILNSIDGKFNCNVTLSRTDIFLNIPENNTQNFADLLRIQKDNSENIFSFLVGRNITINRIGFVVIAEKILSSEGGDSCDYLRNSFVRDDKFSNPKELMFRYNQASSSENFEINNLITINGKTGNKIIIQTDINTVAELMSSASFNANNFDEIIDYAMQKTQELINNFPNI